MTGQRKFESARGFLITYLMQKAYPVNSSNYQIQRVEILEPMI